MERGEPVEVEVLCVDAGDRQDVAVSELLRLADDLSAEPAKVPIFETDSFQEIRFHLFVVVAGQGADSRRRQARRWQLELEPLLARFRPGKDPQPGAPRLDGRCRSLATESNISERRYGN